MQKMFEFDAYTPKQIAKRVETVGVAKARLPFLPMFLLGILAGAFIGLGALFFVLVKSDASLGYAVGQMLGGSVLVALVYHVICGRDPAHRQ